MRVFRTEFTLRDPCHSKTEITHLGEWGTVFERDRTSPDPQGEAHCCEKQIKTWAIAWHFLPWELEILPKLRKQKSLSIKTPLIQRKSFSNKWGSLLFRFSPMTFQCLLEISQAPETSKKHGKQGFPWLRKFLMLGLFRFKIKEKLCLTKLEFFQRDWVFGAQNVSSYWEGFLRRKAMELSAGLVPKRSRSKRGRTQKHAMSTAIPPELRKC